ncbi:hypothetical protein [Desulfuromonas thiophila]|uniref:hypothetical protein n=1 Tax=Desulfuromonas thiophila TaxID=57664 RepID=UPI0024A9AD7C|nr:hypothetical protein [Desulfuromonas thiophila]
MRKPIVIGTREFKYKKEAIAFYRAILNSYDFGQSLSDVDYIKMLDLLKYGLFFEHDYSSDNDLEIGSISETAEVSNDYPLFIEDIKVSKVQFNTKCFEIFYSDNTSQYISYLMIINRKRFTQEDLFKKACRNAIKSDVRAVKQKFFDDNSVKGKVKCQETDILSSWTELVIDHRQPNTFSIIVDRFKEINQIDMNRIEYISDDQNNIVFKDEKLAEAFVSYHKEKARLRIVRKECNSMRAGMGRVKQVIKDLIISGD